MAVVAAAAVIEAGEEATGAMEVSIAITAS